MNTKMLSAIAISSLLCSAAYAAESRDDVRISFNGSVIAARGQIVDDRTLVPVRGVFNEMGFAVKWSEEERTAYLWNSGHKIALPADSDSFTVDGKSVAPDVPQTIIDDSLYLPLRAISEAVGADVEWDGSSRTAVIEKQPQLPESADGTVSAVIDEAAEYADGRRILYLYDVYDDDVYKLDLTDKAYTLSLYGESIPFDELREDDIVSVAYDTEVGFDGSEYYAVYVSRDTVEGKVTDVDDSGDIPVYTVETYDGESMTLPSLWGRKFDIEKYDYTYYLDAFGRVVDVECLGGYPFEITYGVLDGLKYSDGRYYAVITDENGSRDAELRDSATAGRISGMLYGNREEDNTVRTDGSRKDILNRMVFYAYDRDGRICFVQNLKTWSVSGGIGGYLDEREYKDNKLGRIELGPDKWHRIVDVRNHDIDGTYKAVGYDELNEGETYRYGRLKNILFLY